MGIRPMLAAAALAVVAAVPAAAQEKPIQIALVTPIQLVPESQGVGVIRLNFIYSVNKSVRYFDWGLVNMTSGGPSAGVQWAFISVNKGSFTGWQASLAAVTQGPFVGLQSGLFTSSQQGQGVQWSAVNTSANWRGLQFGFVNYAKRISGIQIGLINIIQSGGQFPVFPIVNWGK